MFRDKQIIYMDSRSGIDYAFMPIDGSAPLAWQDAHEQMQARGAKLVDVIWVQNHWPLILWKQAGILKATVSAGKSDELSNQKIWSFETVLTQLLYRYVRCISF